MLLEVHLIGCSAYWDKLATTPSTLIDGYSYTGVSDKVITPTNIEDMARVILLHFLAVILFR